MKNILLIIFTAISLSLASQNFKLESGTYLFVKYILKEKQLKKQKTKNIKRIKINSDGGFVLIIQGKGSIPSYEEYEGQYTLKKSKLILHFNDKRQGFKRKYTVVNQAFYKRRLWSWEVFSFKGVRQELIKEQL